ncbi:hypothetical protein ACTD5D_01955 [Nocardia takedensis]|uniref:hypothetical protein n=1 Tax=Nocardia takedensis TaxID=259390 RepID=UPI0012F70602|nr:hypothetical protein [Nocardia takedensis]
MTSFEDDSEGVEPTRPDTGELGTESAETEEELLHHAAENTARRARWETNIRKREKPRRPGRGEEMWA